MKKEIYKKIKNLSHEFKNPVANLNLILETLYEYDKTLSVFRKKEILQLGLTEIKRLQDLIHYFSGSNYQIKIKEENDKQLQKIDSLNEIILVYDTLSFQKNIFVKLYKYNKKSFGLVNIDLKTYKNVVFNLLGNANKFINYHGWIILEVDIITSISILTFNYTSISRSAVVDNGVGMTPDTQLLIKSTNSLSHNNTKRIGLSIVEEMLSTYCLLLSIVSYPSRGTKFYFDIIMI